MTFETDAYPYVTDSNQNQYDMEYNLPDFNSYAFGSPTYSASSSSNHSAVGSAPSVLDDDTLLDTQRRVSFIKEPVSYPYEYTKRESISPLYESIHEIRSHHSTPERPLLTPPTEHSGCKSIFQNKAKTTLLDSPGDISPFDSQSIMHPYCYSLPPLTCYSSNCKCNVDFPFAYHPNHAHNDEKNNSRSIVKALKYRYEKVLTTAPRRYQCTLCVKRFTRPSSLATHMHSHTGEKPYQCEVEGCGRRFSVVSNLRRHAKIHLQPS